MSRSPSDRMHRQVRRLFNIGAIGTLSDGQLLDRFVARRDEAAEAAFEELVSRHGPMVLRVCRSVLHDAHDAEDAFQAVFLVLANRAGSIDRTRPVAGWLFGVARRVAYRGKRSAARRRVLNQFVAERTGEGDDSAENDVDDEFLHEEIDGLPEHLRTPVVLFYLEGLTYTAAANRLGLSEATLRGRLARARDRLRRRLSARGVTAPAGRFVADAVRQSQASIPPTLIQGTVRMALGYLEGNTAAVLARGVLQTMLLDRIKLAAIVLGLGLGGSYFVWQAFASAVDRKDPSQVGPTIAKPPESSQPRTDRYGDPLPPGAAMRLGTVRFRQFPQIDHISYSPDGQVVVTDSEQNYLQVWDARDGRKLRRIDAGMEQIRDFVFSPDGTQFAVLGCGPVPDALRWHARLTILDVATGRLIRRAEWNLDESERKIAFAPDGKTIATQSDVGTVCVWDVATAKLLHRERPKGRPKNASIAFSPIASSHLLAFAWDRNIHLWDAAHFRDAKIITVDGEGQPTGVAYSPDGTTLAAGVASAAAEIRLWRVSDGTLLRSFKSRKSIPAYLSIDQVLFSPDGKVVLGEGYHVRPVLFEVESGKELSSFGQDFDLVEESSAYGRTVAFSPTGATLATTGGREALHFWDLATAQDRLATPDAHQAGVYAVAFPAGGRTLISGSQDRTVRIWDLATGQPTRVLPHDGWVWSLGVSANGAFLAAEVATFPMSIHLWDLKAAERLHRWPIEGATAESAKVRSVTLTGDGAAVIVTLADCSVRCWDLVAKKERVNGATKLEKPFDPAAAAALPPVPHTARITAFLKEGRTKVIVERIPGKSIKLASGETREDYASAGTMIVWFDSETGHVRREIEIPRSDVQHLTLSPDEQLVAAAYFSKLYPPARGFIRIFRLRDKREIQTIESPCAWIDALAFTPDGKQIAAGLQDSSIVLWDVKPTEERR
jgi:RNA polymerase sigma factor (sigma-70 family)